MDNSQAQEGITLGGITNWKEPEDFKELKKKYTREELAVMLSAEALCILFTPEKYSEMYLRNVPKRFKEIAKEEKVLITKEKLPRGKKSYTPEELRRILTPEEFYQMFTPEELCEMFTPEELCQMFTPEQLCQTFTGHKLCEMYTLEGLCSMFTEAQLGRMRFPM